MLVIFYFLLSFLFLFLFFSIIFWSFKNGITPSATSKKQRKALFKLIHHFIPQNFEGTILELGSGFFPLARQIAKQFPENKTIAYETSLIPYLFSKAWLLILPIKNLKIIRKDFFLISCKDATLILCYLYPEAMEKLEVKFKQELAPNTYIISNTFAIPGKKPLETAIVKDIYHTRIYLYKIL